jgi:tetrahydromethanopterin S-methyltransferase subunit B
MATSVPDGTEITPVESLRLANGLIAYGAIGIALAIGAIVAVFWLDGAFGETQRDVAAQVDQLEATIDQTATSLRDTADSVDGFRTTFESTATGLGQMGEVTTRLAGVVDDLATFFATIKPFVGSVPALDGVSEQLVGLEPSLVRIAGDLTTNRDQLGETSASLRDLAAQLDEVETTLASGVIDERVGQGFDFLRAAIIALTIWLALPAIAAFLIGIWLRRAVAPHEPVSPAAPG